MSQGFATDMHTSESNPRLYTIAEYAGFIRRRWRFIVAGTLLVVVVVGGVSLVLRNVFSSSAVIDAGTLGARRAERIDNFRDRVNAGGYRGAIADFAPGRVTKAWMAFDEPNIFLRVDALDGPTAAAGAKRLVDHVMAELAKIPVFSQDDLDSSPASANDATAIRSSFQKLEDWVAQQLADARAERQGLTASRAERQGLTASRARILGRMRALASSDVQASGKQWRLLIDELSKVIETLDRADQSIPQLETARARLEAMRIKPVSQTMVPALRKDLDARPRSIESLVTMIGNLDTVLSKTPVQPVPLLVPLRLIAAPQVPKSPAWPKRTLNVLIALLFGVVGSSFAALLLEHAASTRSSTERATTAALLAGRRE